MNLVARVDRKSQRHNDTGAVCGRYMDKIVEYVEVIVANKFAYVANESVYFDTRAFRYVILLLMSSVLWLRFSWVR